MPNKITLDFNGTTVETLASVRDVSTVEIRKA